MRVTYVSGFAGMLWRGGGTIQAVRTAEACRALRVGVEFFTPLTERLGDLVHFFGSEVEYRPIARYCVVHRVPYVVSPMFYLGRSRLRYADWWVSSRLNRTRQRHLRRLMAGAEAVLPNTTLEIPHLRQVLRVPAARMRLIPPGVEDRFAMGEPELFRQEFGVREPFVLSVGRVEPLKNQLTLIRALRDTGMQIVLVGAAANAAYAERCRREGGSRVLLAGAIAPDSPLLPSAYAACRVFAMLSRSESIGLGGLEAAAAGAPVVMTLFAGAREHLGDWAEYVHPFRPGQIREAVCRLWDEPAERRLERAASMRGRLLWEEVGRQTVAVYHRVVAPDRAASAVPAGEHSP